MRITLVGCVISVALLLIGLPTAQAWTEKAIYTFPSFGGNDGSYPNCQPIFDHNGNLFGTTSKGGTHFGGTVFELSPTESGPWTETLIYEFTGRTDGGYPLAGLTFDAQGNLYGTAGRGGANGTGAVFELSPQGSGWVYRVLYSFGASLTGDGVEPNSPVIFDDKGNLYGTTFEGGHSGCFTGCGTVFELSPDGSGGWTETLIHSFKPNGSDGELPGGGGVTLLNGSLYGTTTYGGAYGSGVLFRLKYSPARQTWLEDVLYIFFGGGGSNPGSVVLIADPAGNLYGTTQYGGIWGLGTIFKATYSQTSGWSVTQLYSFSMFGSDGNIPQSGVIMDSKGNLYGTTFAGGNNYYGYGTVFKLSQSNGTWTETILYDFQGENDGANPQEGLRMWARRLYGTATDFGGFDGGTVYQISP